MSRPAKLSAMIPKLRRVLRKLRPYLWRHLPLMAGSCAALLAAVAMQLLEPWPLKLVIDGVLLGREVSLPGAGDLVSRLAPATLLSLSALVLVAVYALQALFAYLATVGFALVGNRLLAEVRQDLFVHLQRLPLSFHGKARTGDLAMRVVNDVGILKETAVTAVLPMAMNLLVLAGMFTVMGFMNPTLALIAILPLPLLWLTTIRLGNKIQSVAAKQREQEGALASAATEAFSAIKTVQTLAAEDSFSARFEAGGARGLKEDVRGKRLAANLERTVDVLVGLATAAVLWYGAALALEGRLSPGDLIVFLTYLRRAFKPVRDFAKYMGRVAKATAAGERVVDLLETEPEIRDVPCARPARPFQGHVRFENVTFGYDPRRPVLTGFDLEIRPGEWVALVGPSGAGKSTLASLLLRLNEPQRGRVLIDRSDIAYLQMRSVRRQVSLLLQDPVLFSTTVRENIAIGVPHATDAEIEVAARIANAHGFITAMPEGYGTEIAERGANLSGGQRQRIAIARAALRNAPILVLDEPTTGLDRACEEEVREALVRIARGRTTLLITHDLAFAARADRIIVLGGGRVVEDGSHAELLASGGPYANLLRPRPVAAEPAAENGVRHAVAR